MAIFQVNLNIKCAEFLKSLSEEHDVNARKVINGLCDWAFSSADYKMQFEVWLDKVYPPKGQAEDKAKAEGEEASARRGVARCNGRRSPRRPRLQ